MSVVELVTSLDQLTQDEQSKVKSVMNDERVASLVNHHEKLVKFCSLHTYVRYLRARNWHVEKAIKLLRGTLEWRLSYKPDEIMFSQVEEDARSGKIFYITDAHKEGRPVMVMRPRNEISLEHERNLRYMVYCMETGCALAEKNGLSKVLVIVDYYDVTKAKQPGFKTSKATLSILQNHYPERLDHSLCTCVGKLFYIMWQLIQPFMDPVTREKIQIFPRESKRLSPTMAKWCDMEKMEEVFGGKLENECYLAKQPEQFKMVDSWKTELESQGQSNGA